LLQNVRRQRLAQPVRQSLIHMSSFNPAITLKVSQYREPCSSRSKNHSSDGDGNASCNEAGPYPFQKI